MAYHYLHYKAVLMIKLNKGQLSLKYIVCELRSRFLSNIFLNVIFAKIFDTPKSRNLDTDIMNNTQTISKDTHLFQYGDSMLSSHTENIALDEALFPTNSIHVFFCFVFSYFSMKTYVVGTH